MKPGFLILAVSSAAWAQSQSPAADARRQMLGGRETTTVAAFEEMPAGNYDYRPSPEQMTFGRLAAHIAESNNFFCSGAGGAPQPKTEKFEGTEGKEKLVAAIRASFEFSRTPLLKADDSRL